MELVLIGFKVHPDVKTKLEDLAWRRRTTVTKVLKRLVDAEIARNETEL